MIDLFFPVKPQITCKPSFVHRVGDNEPRMKPNRIYRKSTPDERRQRLIAKALKERDRRAAMKIRTELTTGTAK